MKIKPKQYAVALYEAIKDAPREKARDVLDNFVKTLAKNNALRLAPQIIDYFTKYANQVEGIADLKIKSTEPIKGDLAEKIKKVAPAILRKNFKKINIIEEIDKSLVGGFVLECDDAVFDASIKNKFQTLNKILN
ncbi:ATP synthase F1 subunit delta [Candidatus Falkowbacteria bacterium]|nr:ATP synthase F1 subunit delta [Candidatus Falkowbacteria bacterium]